MFEPELAPPPPVPQERTCKILSHPPLSQIFLSYLFVYLFIHSFIDLLILDLLIICIQTRIDFRVTR